MATFEMSDKDKVYVKVYCKDKVYVVVWSIVRVNHIDRVNFHPVGCLQKQ